VSLSRQPLPPSFSSNMHRQQGLLSSYPTRNSSSPISLPLYITHMHTYAHTNIHTHTHARTHAHTHTQARRVFHSIFANLILSAFIQLFVALIHMSPSVSLTSNHGIHIQTIFPLWVSYVEKYSLFEMNEQKRLPINRT